MNEKSIKTLNDLLAVEPKIKTFTLDDTVASCFTIAQDVKVSIQFHVIGLVEQTFSDPSKVRHYIMLITERNGDDIEVHDAALWMAATPDGRKPITKFTGITGNSHFFAVEKAVKRLLSSFPDEVYNNNYPCEYLGCIYDVPISDTAAFESGIIHYENNPNADRRTYVTFPSSRRYVISDDGNGKAGFHPPPSIHFQPMWPSSFTGAYPDDPFKHWKDSEQQTSNTSDQEPESEVQELRAKLNELRTTLVTVKDIIREYTENHDGCRDGKIEWLKDLGIFEPYEIVEIVGGTWSVAGEIKLTLPVAVEVDAHNIDEALEISFDRFRDLIDVFSVRLDQGELTKDPDYDFWVDTTSPEIIDDI